MADNETPKAPAVGIRHLQCLLAFMALAASFSCRYTLFFAITVMMDKNGSNPNYPEYAWSEKTKAWLLSSFQWGYFVTQLPGGPLAHYFGAKRTLMCSVGISGLMSALIPLATHIGDYKGCFIARVLQGLGQGVLFPSVHTLVAHWAPPRERGFLVGMTYAGGTLGIVTIMCLSGFLATSRLGWPSIYYLAGLFCLAFIIAMFIWGASSPREYKNISDAERRLIDESWNEALKAEEQTKALPTPWLKILTSVPFICLVIESIGNGWSGWTVSIQVPSYLKFILKFDVESNAILTGLPYLVAMFATFFFASLSRWVEKRQLFSVNFTRKGFNTIGQYGPMACTILLGYIGPEQYLIGVALLLLSGFLSAASAVGFLANHIDLSPNFAGILMSGTNFSANFAGVFAPLVVGCILSDPRDIYQWRLVFYQVAITVFIANLIWIIFGSTKLQPWNEPVKKESSAT